jgi:hypothetical protein
MSFLPAASSSDAMEAAWPTHKVERRADELHRIVDRKPGRHDAARRVDVHCDLFLRIVRFQEQELGDHEGRHHILDRTGDEDDALL